MNEPYVSIIIPVYNAEAYIGNAIKSVQEQTFKNWELIIVNDGSTDNTLSILNSICKVENDNKIRTINITNSGVSFA